MTPEQLAQILDELGTRLGPTGQHVFELAVRQVYINAAVVGIIFGVWLLITLVAAVPAYRWSQSGNSYSDRGFVLGTISVFWGIGGLLLFIMVVIYVPSIFNPEYAAIRDILSAIGRAK